MNTQTFHIPRKNAKIQLHSGVKGIYLEGLGMVNRINCSLTIMPNSPRRKSQAPVQCPAKRWKRVSDRLRLWALKQLAKGNFTRCPAPCINQNRAPLWLVLWEFTQSHSTMRGWFGKECGFMMMCTYHICLLLYIAANFHCNKTTCIPWVETHPKKHRGAGDFLHQVTQCHPKVKDGILRVGLFVAQEKVPGALWIGYHMCFLSRNPRTNHVFLEISKEMKHEQRQILYGSMATAWAWEGTLW